MRKTYLIIIVALTLLLSACGSTATPEAIPTVVLGDTSNNVPVQPVSNNSNNSNGAATIASAVIIPAQEAELAFVTGGNVMKVNVKVGDRVTAGHILVELDNTLAQLEVERASRILRELTSPAAIAAAEKAVATAQNEYDDAKKKVDSLKYRNTDNLTVDYLQDQVTLAQDALDRARDAYNNTAGRSDLDPVRAKAGTNLYNAQKAYNSAQGNLDWYTKLPSENDIAITNADFDAATASLQEAQWYLAALKGESIPTDATGAKLAQLQQAKADERAAQNRLDQSRLIAPISGVIAQANVIAGEYASPGKVLVIVSDMGQLQAKTTDLSERDIVNVNIGDPATITVNALNKDFSAQVVNISPLANTLGGDVVYEVTLAFDEQPQGALGGMTAEITIGK